MLKFFNSFPGILLWLRLPAFISWCAISTGILIVSTFFKNGFDSSFIHSSLYNIALFAAILSLVGGVIAKRLKFRFLYFLFAGILVYILYLSHKESMFHYLGNIAGKQIFVYGKVCSPLLPYPDNLRFLFSIDSSSADNKFLRKNVVLCISKDSVIQGSSLKLSGVIKLPGRQKNPHEFDEYSFLLSNGISSRFIVDSISQLAAPIPFAKKVSNHFRSGVSKVINLFTVSDHRALLYAAFLGETEYLSADQKLSFRRSGIYHLLSISGLHAAMLIAACYFTLSLLPIPLLYRHCISLIAIWLYQCFIGFIPCLFRATIMATMIIITFIFQKKNYTVQAIGLAGTIWLLFSPDNLFQPGFQLSFAATFGILTIYPVLQRFLPDIQNRFLNYAVSNLLTSFYLSLTGLICTTPVILYYFGSVSIYGLIANLIAVPAMSIAMWFFFAAIICSIFLPFLTSTPVYFCKLMLSIITASANFSLNLPFCIVDAHAFSAGFLLIFVLVFIAIATVKIKFQKKLIILSIPILLGSAAADIVFQRFSKSIDITEFSAEPGTMYSVKWTDQKVWLFINCPNPEKIGNFLKTAQNWIRHQGNASFSLVFYSGPDIDSEIQAILPSTRLIQLAKKGIPIKDSISFIINSRSVLTQSQNICTIKNRNDSLFAKISKGDAEVYFPLQSNIPCLTIHNKSTNHYEFKTNPCIVQLRKNKCTIFQ